MIANATPEQLASQHRLEQRAAALLDRIELRAAARTRRHCATVRDLHHLLAHRPDLTDAPATRVAQILIEGALA